MKYCEACEDQFEPKVSKISKYCSADCAYDREGKNVEKCSWCGDDFDKAFTKTFVGCSQKCDRELGMHILERAAKHLLDRGEMPGEEGPNCRSWVMTIGCAQLVVGTQ